MRLPEFQRRLVDCPVFHQGPEIVAILLREDMVDLPTARALSVSEGSTTRIIPRKGVLHAFALADVARRAAILLADGCRTENDQKQLAIYRRVIGDDEWPVVEQLAATVPPRI